jgi:hypothetical protein
MEQVHAAVFQAHPRSTASDSGDPRGPFGINIDAATGNGAESAAVAARKPSRCSSKVAHVVWHPVGRSADDQEWLHALVVPKDGENALVLTSECGTKEKARIPLTKSLKWQRHKPTVGILFQPPRAVGSLAFHFESSHQADVLAQIVSAAIAHSKRTSESLRLLCLLAVQLRFLWDVCDQAIIRPLLVMVFRYSSTKYRI